MAKAETDRDPAGRRRGEQHAQLQAHHPSPSITSAQWASDARSPKAPSELCSGSSLAARVAATVVRMPPLVYGSPDDRAAEFAARSSGEHQVRVAVHEPGQRGPATGVERGVRGGGEPDPVRAAVANVVAQAAVTYSDYAREGLLGVGASRYVRASTRACQLASTTFSCTPTVVQSRPDWSTLVTSTRVIAPVPWLPSRMRTL